MSYNNKKREENSANHKKAIIESAKALVYKEGYNNISVEKICSEAGVAKGSFYIHYKSKDDIIPDLIGNGFDEIKVKAYGYKNWGGIKFFVIESAKLIVEMGLKMAQMWFSDSVKSTEYGRYKLGYDYDAINELLVSLGVEKTKVPEYADKIMSSFYGALILWCMSDGKIDPVNIMKDFFKRFEYDLEVKNE